MSAHKYKRAKKHRPSHRPRSAVRVEKFLEGAISSIRHNSGSTTCKSICNLISMDYGWPKKEVEKHVNIALKKAVASGLVEFADGRYKLGNIRRFLRKFSNKSRRRKADNVTQINHDEIL